MRNYLLLSLLGLCAFSTAQTVSETSQATITTTSDSETSSPTSSTTTGGSSGSETTTGSPSYGSNPPDVLLKVPELHVGKIELIVDDLKADINLAAQVANLVELNAGIQVGVTQVNITIADVDAQLDLVIRLGNLVDIVNRTLESLNLNPLLINVLEEATDLVDAVVGAVDGLLGTIVNGDSTVSFLIDNLGNIVQNVESAGSSLLSSIGNYEQNMTYTGQQEILKGGLIQKTYSYEPLNALVNIVTNAANQVVQAVVIGSGGGGSSSSSTTTATATPAPSARR